MSISIEADGHFRVHLSGSEVVESDGNAVTDVAQTQNPAQPQWSVYVNG